MSDEKPLPIPRLPEKRKPEHIKKLTKKELARLDDHIQESDMLTVDERACAHLCVEFNKEHAATMLNWTLEEVEETINLPHVKLYLKRSEDAFHKELAKAKVRRMQKVGVTRETVEARLMEIAMMDPEHTKGSVEGQVKALNTLTEILGMKASDDPSRGKTREEMQRMIQSTAARLLPAPPKDDPPIN